MTVEGSRRAATAALSLPTISSSEISSSAPSVCPKRVGSTVSSMLMPDTPACSSSIDRAHDVQRIAVAMVGVHDEREVGCAHDAPDLVGELGERQDDQVGRRERRVRRDRSGQHAELVADRFGHARGQRDRKRSPGTGTSSRQIPRAAACVAQCGSCFLRSRNSDWQFSDSGYWLKTKALI